MAEAFSLEDILGPPKSSIRMNYGFEFIGKNTRLVGTKSISYPPIKDDLVEKKIVKAEEEEGDWLGWGLNLVIGIAVTAACAVVAVAAAPVTVTVAVVAGCAAVGSAVATTAIAITDYHNGTPHPRVWWEAAGGSLFGTGLGAVVGAELCYFPSMIAGTAEAVGLQASMWAGVSTATSVAIPKLATGLGYGLLGMNTIFGMDQATGVGDGETLLRRQNPELYDNLAMLSMILTEGYSTMGAAQQAIKGNGDNESGSKSDELILKGTEYSAEYAQKLKDTYKLFKSNGYEISEHGLNRALGRINQGKINSIDNVIDVLNTGTKYIDMVNGGNVLFKDGISIHIAEDGFVKTVIGKAKVKSTWEVIE